MHLFQELAYLDVPVEERLETVREPFDRDCREMEFEVHEGGRPEVAYAYNVLTKEARELGQSIGRRYVECGVDPEVEVAGAVDVVWHDGFDLHVDDLKTGKYPPQAEGNYQLYFGGLCASKVENEETAVVAITRPDGSRDEHHLCEWDRDQFEIQLEEMVKEKHWQKRLIDAGLPPRVNPGEHCRFCPAKKACPAKGEL